MLHHRFYQPGFFITVFLFSGAVQYLEGQPVGLDAVGMGIESATCSRTSTVSQFVRLIPDGMLNSLKFNLFIILLKYYIYSNKLCPLWTRKAFDNCFLSVSI